MTYIGSVLSNWQDFGIHVLLTFLLVFTLVYAILQKTKILGEKKNFNVAISLVLAMLVILDPYKTVINLIAKAIPNLSIWLVAILCFFLIIGLFGGTSTWKNNIFSGWIAILAAIVVLGIFLHSAGLIMNLTNIPGFGWLNDPQMVSTVIVLLTFIFIIWFVTKGDEGSDFSLSKSLGELADNFTKGDGK
jgi:hypothetical protein